MKLYSSKTLRTHIIPYLFFLSDEQKWRLACWLRGRKEYRKLQQTELVVVSYPKSGRTWLRTMLSRYFQLTRGIPEGHLLGFNNYHLIDPAVPKIFFTHDNVINHYTGNWQTKKDYYSKRVILLVRDPRDVVVSLYFHSLHRMDPLRKGINPRTKQENLSLFELMLHDEWGLPAIIRFLNTWASELPNIENTLVVHYESMRRDPARAAADVLGFFSLPYDQKTIDEICNYTAFDNMKKMEQKGVYDDKRLRPTKNDNPNSFKVRRGKVGGYRDYLNEAELQRIEELVAETLTPFFGYHSSPPQRNEAAGNHDIAKPEIAG